MAKVKPFKGLRPNEKWGKEVSCLPYDVMSREEAKAMGADEKSFLHIVRSEIDLPESVDVHDDTVYEKAAENFKKFREKEYLIEDEKPVFYIYRQIMDGRVQTGIAGAASTFDYENNIIKKHEFTRPEKEIDRIKNFEACQAHTEPVFFAHRENKKLKDIINKWTKEHKPAYDFISEDEITHTLWVVNDDKTIKDIENIYDEMDYLYIADGHHRTASSYEVGKKLRKNSETGEEEYNFILSVMFDASELAIMDYNRFVYSLAGNSKEEFLEKIKEKFTVKEVGEKNYKPAEKHEFSMYLDGKWYSLTAKEGTFDKNDPVKSLDADILQKNLLAPILNIDDPRTSSDIEFIGGIRGMEELKKRVDAKEGSVAFAVYPVTMEDLFSVADADMVMPPKSTWFEPKLRSGLFIHQF